MNSTWIIDVDYLLSVHFVYRNHPKQHYCNTVAQLLEILFLTCTKQSTRTSEKTRSKQENETKRASTRTNTRARTGTLPLCVDCTINCKLFF